MHSYKNHRATALQGWGGEAFDPVLYLVEDKRGDKSFWFPYWIKVRDKWRYGQYASIFDESQFLKLLLEAIRQDFFSAHFLKEIEQAIVERIRIYEAAS